MTRYRVTFDVEASSIEGAALCAQLGAARATVRNIVVFPIVEPTAGPRWAVTVLCERGSEVAVVFDAESERGMVAVTQLVAGTIAVTLKPAALATLIRAMQSFPIDLLDAMADADQRERTRRGG